MRTDERIRVLVADNLPHFADQCAQFLERAGYRVTQAHSLEEARYHLQHTHLHVAVLDMRLVSDRDPEDTSGVTLALDSDPSIEKIILTAYADYRSARAALTPQPCGHAPVLAYLGKDEGFEVLEQKVIAAVARLGISSGTRYDWDRVDPLAVARAILPDEDSERILEQGGAVGDLLKRLFGGFEHLLVVRSTFESERRIALEVRAHHSAKGLASFIVVFASKIAVIEEVRRFREYSPGACTTVPFLRGVATTTQLGAIAYDYSSARFDDARTISDLYKFGTEASLQLAFRRLFSETLPAWHTGHPSVRFTGSVSDLRSSPAIVSLFGDRVSQLSDQLVKLGLDVAATSTRWTLRVGDRSLTFPNPGIVFARVIESVSRPLVRCVPGRLRPETLIVLKEGAVLAIDFNQAGPAPCLQPFVELECAVRFDLWFSPDPGEVLDVERSLSSSTLLPLSQWSGPASHRRLARSVATIRQCAADRIRNDAASYHGEVIHQIVARLHWLSERRSVTDEDLDRLAHLVIASAMLAQSLERLSVGVVQGRGVRIDAEHRRVYIDGEEIELSRQNYDLLLVLYRHAGSTCSREKLVTEIFRQAFDANDKSQEDRLNTAIYRLRDRLEPDKSRPVYIVNEADGYVFRSVPEDL